MRAIVQRVTRARVTVAGETTGEIAAGLLVLLGVTHGDTAAGAAWLAEKIVNLRILADADGKMNRSALDASAGVLVVSQFTLYGETAKGRRPSFVAAAPPDLAEPLYDEFVRRVRLHGLTVATGRFGANMLVELVNDGPVTLIVETGLS